MSPTPDRPCPACGAAPAPSFFAVSDVPVLVCALWPDPASAAACPRGDLELGFCGACGLITNRAFDPARVEYTEGYENSLSFSEFFQGYLRELARDVFERHALAGKRVVEIGSGDGEFLTLLCELGAGEGVGFDPSYPAGRPDELAGGRARVVRDYYSEEHSDVRADLVVCRQVLEHVPDPAAFLGTVRRALGGRPEAAVVFEVPNALYTLRELSLWDVIYEHCTYFSQGSLARLFAAQGFDVTDTWETYARQFIAVDARPAARGRGAIETAVDDLETLAAEVRRFGAAAQERIASWRAELAEHRAAGRTVALWGSGARGVNFLNIADPDHVVQHVVDINPRKHGLCVAGTGQRVGPPDELARLRPDVVIVMNPNYVEEITASLHALGLAPEVRLA